MSQIEEYLKKHNIKHAVEQMFCPPRCDWKGRDGSTISRLMAETGSKYETVEDVLMQVQAGLDIGVDVDVRPRLMGRGGQNAKIQPGTAAADAMIG
eukprot:SAG25_NODE_3932_length_925_cov_1.217918_2_plen_95_part_01